MSFLGKQTAGPISLLFPSTECKPQRGKGSVLYIIYVGQSMENAWEKRGKLRLVKAYGRHVTMLGTSSAWLRFDSSEV